MELFKILGRIFINSEGAKKDLGDTEKKVKQFSDRLKSGMGTAAKWGAGITTAAVGVAGAATAMVSKVADGADHVDKMSQKIGVSAEYYQEMDYVMGQSGMSIDSLQTSMRTLVGSMDGAANGNAKNAAAFERLGVAVTDSQGNLRTQEEVMKDTLSALQGVENQTEKAKLANELFGRSGSEMMPLLNGAAGSIDEMRERAHELGAVMSDDMVSDGAAFNDTMDDLQRSFGAIARDALGELMPALTEIGQQVVAMMPEISASLGPVISAIGKLIPPVMQLLKAILPPLMTLIQRLAPVIGTVLKVAIDGVVLVIKGFSAAWTAVRTVVSAVWGSIKEAFTEGTGVVMAIFGPLVNYYKEQWNNIRKVFNGIIDFVTGVFTGNWEKAWEGVKEIFGGVFNGLMEMFKLPINFIINGINLFIKGLNMLKIPDWVPFVGGKSLNIREIPQLAKGGIVDKPTIAEIGEAGPEAVTPIPVLQKYIADAVSDKNDALIEVMREVLDAVKSGQVIQMDSGALVGATAREMDEQLEGLRQADDYGGGRLALVHI